MRLILGFCRGFGRIPSRRILPGQRFAYLLFGIQNPDFGNVAAAIVAECMVRVNGFMRTVKLS